MTALHLPTPNTKIMHKEQTLFTQSPTTCSTSNTLPEPHEIISDQENLASEPSNSHSLASSPASRSSFTVIGDSTRQFMQEHFPGVSAAQWNDWRWQIRNRIQTADQLCAHLPLFQDELDALNRGRRSLPFAITPYYLSLINANDAHDPIRLCTVPSCQEFAVSPGEQVDPLNEDGCSPVPGIVHRYPNRVLFLVTDFCSVCCRYCTRSRLIGKVHRENCRINQDAAFAYIESHPEIEDVLVSGGDPLTLPLAALEHLLARLRAIKHVKIIRIGSKVPAVLPQRVTPALVSMLRKYHPLYLSLHFTHPRELTPETSEACRLLANAGIPLGSQTVLLKGVNDNLPAMRDLLMGLLAIRVKPYYLFQCDPIHGSKHFRTPVQTGLDLIRGLRGYITGYAIPHYVIDAPGGGGKVPIVPQYVLGHDQEGLAVKNYAGKLYHYPDYEAPEC